MSVKEFEIQIKHGISKPARRTWAVKVKEAIYAMNEGDSFIVPNVGVYHSTIAIGKKLGAKLSGHRIEGENGYHISLDEAPAK
jgi:hypothetical protein